MTGISEFAIYECGTLMMAMLSCDLKVGVAYVSMSPTSKSTTKNMAHYIQPDSIQHFSIARKWAGISLNVATASLHALVAQQYLVHMILW